MPHRYKAAVKAFPGLAFKPAHALRESFRRGYGKRDFVSDLMAGLVVGVVALPLSMALAIASGVPPQHGLYTAIIAGGLITLLGGARIQVSGPTAAFVVILAPISAKYGIGGLLVATMMAGILMIVMGAVRLGRLIEFIPHPVTTGFTAGIATVIATLQLKDLFGLSVDKMPETFLGKVGALFAAAPTVRWQDFAIGGTTLAVLIIWPKITKRVPGPLIALSLAAVAAYVLNTKFGFDITTIASKFTYKDAAGLEHHGIPPYPPTPSFPWLFGGPDGKPVGLSSSMIYSLVPSAFAIAMLGAIESLLCAVVADGMSGNKHDPDAELLAQGIGNVVAPFFGGIAATGAIARSATAIRAGARSPLAAFIHALFVLAAMLALAPLLGYLPMPSLAALLILVAWNMSELRHFRHILAVAPLSDVAVLVACFSLTVIFDMTVGVSVGVILAALLFMRRMADISKARLVEERHREVKDLPADVTFYEISGPLFFGAAQKAMSALGTVSKARAVIIDIESVPTMDVTGLVALESAVTNLNKAGAFVAIGGVQEQPMVVLRSAGLKDSDGKLKVCASVDDAIAAARAQSQAKSVSTPEAHSGAPTHSHAH